MKESEFELTFRWKENGKIQELAISGLANIAIHTSGLDQPTAKPTIEPVIELVTPTTVKRGRRSEGADLVMEKLAAMDRPVRFDVLCRSVGIPQGSNWGVKNILARRGIQFSKMHGGKGKAPDFVFPPSVGLQATIQPSEGTEHVRTKQLRRLFRKVSPKTWMYESTLLRRSKLSTQTFKKYMAILLNEGFEGGRVICDHTAKGKPKYMKVKVPFVDEDRQEQVQEERHEVSLAARMFASGQSENIIKAVMDYGTIDYLRALHFIPDLTPELWRDYCSIVVSRSKDLAETFKRKGHFIYKDNLLIFQRAK